VKVLVLGASGMLGHAIHRSMSAAGWEVLGCVRTARAPEYPACNNLRYITNVDAADFANVVATIRSERPAVVINALGVIKQNSEASDNSNLIQVNAAFPKKLEILSAQLDFKLVHFSTDCVFTGTVGNYSEDDIPDSTDWYGISKFLGEVSGGKSLTLRTSIIGRGLASNNSLVDWFLSQSGRVTGYSKAIFSGLPVNEIGALLARGAANGLLDLSGLYHLSVAPISKYELLLLLKEAWGRDDIVVDESADFVIDRSLDSSRLREKLNYLPDSWPQLVGGMYEFYKG
jgi:dTDP-4-dehydrorhamnose reductase